MGVWTPEAELLLSLSVAFHPYVKSAEQADALKKDLSPSLEFEHVAALVGYVFTVFNCINEKVDAHLLPRGFNRGLFLKSWVCLLSRSIKTPHGSALIPAVDMFNHKPDADAILDWDPETDALVVKACRPVPAGSEVCIAYGALPNPLMYRTYGFTVPPREEPR